MNNTLTAKKIEELCNGEIFCGDPDLLFTSFSKDTRVLKEGDVYVGIKGEKFDGNLFYKDAFIKGAVGAILERDSFDGNYEGKNTIILVDNSIEALRVLGSFKRDTTEAKFIGVTGSVGKTSTRDLIYSVVKEGYKSLKTEGNFNNEIGLPLTLLRLKDERAAVIEMGMSALGEIDYLSKITRPHIAVITNVGTAHIGELVSRENILKAKLEILSGLEPDGKLIINNDNDLLHEYYIKNKDNKLVSVGIDEESDFMATDIVLNTKKIEFNICYNGKKYPFICPIPNQVFIYNCLVAFAVGTILGIDIGKIRKGIENFKLTKNRSEIFKTEKGITVINDAYNASVDSMKSGLETLKNISSGRTIALLGSMLELGEFSESLHREVGKYVCKNDIDILVTVGEEAKAIAESAVEEGLLSESVHRFDNNGSAIEFLKNTLKYGDSILVKASNGLHFSEIVDVIKNEL